MIAGGVVFHGVVPAARTRRPRGPALDADPHLDLGFDLGVCGEVERGLLVRVLRVDVALGVVGVAQGFDDVDVAFVRGLVDGGVA